MNERLKSLSTKDLEKLIDSTEKKYAGILYFVKEVGKYVDSWKPIYPGNNTQQYEVNDFHGFGFTYLVRDAEHLYPARLSIKYRGEPVIDIEFKGSERVDFASNYRHGIWEKKLAALIRNPDSAVRSHNVKLQKLKEKEYRKEEDKRNEEYRKKLLERAKCLGLK